MRQGYPVHRNIYIEIYIYKNINTVLKMDDVYWYYSLEWCFFFSFLIKTKPQQKKKRKKELKPEKNTKLEQFCLRAEAALGAGSTARCCPRGRRCREGTEQQGRGDAAAVGCATHTQLLLTGLLL